MFISNTKLTQLNYLSNHSPRQIRLMYSASLREIGEYNDMVRLEVRMKFFSSYLESQCCLLETGISVFCLGQGLAYEEYRSLLPVFIFFKQ